MNAYLKLLTIIFPSLSFKSIKGFDYKKDTSTQALDAFKNSSLNAASPFPNSIYQYTKMPYSNFKWKDL